MPMNVGALASARVFAENFKIKEVSLVFAACLAAYRPSNHALQRSGGYPAERLTAAAALELLPGKDKVTYPLTLTRKPEPEPDPETEH